MAKVIRKIYQIGMKPVKKQDYLTEDYFFEHEFLRNVATNIEKTPNRIKAMRSFRERMEKINAAVFSDSNMFVFSSNGKENHFSCRYSSYLSAVSNLQSVTLSEFCCQQGEFDDKTYALNQAVCDRFGDYVQIPEEDCIVPIDEFIRNAKIGESYYIGGILDYYM